MASPADQPDDIGDADETEGPDEQLVSAAIAVDEIDPDAPLPAVADELERLLAAGPPRPALDVDGLRRLRRLREQKKLYDAMSRALTGPIQELNDKLVEHVLDVDDEIDLSKGWSATVGDATGYIQVKDYPAYRHRDELDGEGSLDGEGTGKPFEQSDLIAALLTCEDESFRGLVRQSVHGGQWNAMVQGAVRAWRDRISESGPPRDEQGRFVDAFGNVLTEEEAAEPEADELALPPAVREIVKVSPKINILFRRK